MASKPTPTQATQNFLKFSHKGKISQQGNMDTGHKKNPRIYMPIMWGGILECCASSFWSVLRVFFNMSQIFRKALWKVPKTGIRNMCFHIGWLIKKQFLCIIITVRNEIFPNSLLTLKLFSYCLVLS